MSEALDSIRRRVEALGMGFRFIKPVKISPNGAEQETWLLEYEDSPFIFVPGQKGVTLGWDPEKCPLGGGVTEGLQREFSSGHDYYREQMEEIEEDYRNRIAEAEEEGDEARAEALRTEMAEELEGQRETMEEQGYSDWEGFLATWNEYLSRCMSPLRTADIGDMLAETDSWSLKEDAPSLEEAVRSLKQGPFTLPTEDEWEYLCNGGARTLFRWGDTLEGVMSEIYSVGAVGREAQEEGILERPNDLGLFIAYDSYQNEIIDDLSCTKGGDGGCSLCGGDGAIRVLPCYTAFYRCPIKGGAPLLKNYFCCRRIIRL